MVARANKEWDLGLLYLQGKVLTEQLKFKLDNRWSNNQAEQLAIVKALDVIESQGLKPL